MSNEQRSGIPRSSDGRTLTVWPAQYARGSVTFVNEHSVETVPWLQIDEEACRFAAALEATGASPDTHFCVSGEPIREVVTLLRAILSLGASFTVLPPVTSWNRSGLGRSLAWLKCDYLVAPRDAPELELEVPDGCIKLSLDKLKQASHSHFGHSPSPVSAEQLALVQFTSGSTGEPKGVTVRYGQLLSHVDAIAAAAQFQEEETFVSWLPLYHDMGLIGFLLTPMLLGKNLVLTRPEHFVKSPGIWFNLIDHYRGSITGAPNFAYAVACKLKFEALDLSSLRLAFNGAEMIEPAVVEAFLKKTAIGSLDPAAMFQVYGMAEATLAVAFPDPNAAPQFHECTLKHVGDGPTFGRQPRAVVGSPLAHVDLKLMGDGGRDIADSDQPGEIYLSGSTISDSYLTRDGIEPTLVHDGWFATGDLGYFSEFGLVVCGRIDDMVVVAGRNLNPERIESVISANHGGVLRPGRIVAFGIRGRNGTQDVVIVAETRSTGTTNQALDSLRRSISNTVNGEFGVSPRDIVFVDRGTVPKTSSGKPRRRHCRELYASGQMDP
jgi:fatty-acyl-CoA synthase